MNQFSKEIFLVTGQLSISGSERLRELRLGYFKNWQKKKETKRSRDCQRLRELIFGDFASWQKKKETQKSRDC